MLNIVPVLSQYTIVDNLVIDCLMSVKKFSSTPSIGNMSVEYVKRVAYCGTKETFLTKI